MQLNFIQLCLTLTKLCHIKCDHRVIFFISFEKTWKIATSLEQYDRSPQHLARWRISNVLQIKKFHFKNPRWWMADTLESFCIIMRYCHLSIFKMVAVRYLGILKLRILTASHYRDTFCIIMLNFVETDQTTTTTTTV